MKRAGILLITVLLLAACSANELYMKKYEQRTLTEKERKTFAGSFVKLSAGMTHYELCGKGDACVLFVHGSSLPYWTWDNQIKAITNSGLRVLRYDHYGRGGSDRPNTNYNRELYREQIRELLDALKIKKVLLVSRSFGSMVAVDFAVRYPQYVEKAVFIAPAMDEIGGLARAILRGRSGRRIIPRALMKGYEELDETFREKNIPLEHYTNLFFKQLMYKGVKRSVVSMFDGDAIDSREEEYEKLAETDIPVMIIYGSEDGQIKKRSMRRMKRVMQSASIITIEGIGHQPEFEAPDLLNGLLCSFFREMPK